MHLKAIIQFILLVITGISSVFFFINSFSSKKQEKFFSRKASFVLAIFLMLITLYGSIDLINKAYNKIKTIATSMKNFPETVETESSDTTDYVKHLKKYEPEKYKGKVPDAFYYYYGFRDYWHFPLVYPYAISCIDIIDKGEIENDSGKTNFEEGGLINTISPEFDSFIFDKNYFAAKIYSVNRSGPDEKYFLFSFDDGKKEMFNSKNELMKKLDAVKFEGDRNFITTREYSRRF